MLFRKKQNDIINWINNDKKALLVTGARQIGKTYLIEKTLEQENCNFVSFNLINQPEIIKIFNDVSNDNVSKFLERLTIASNKKLKKGETIIFFDEIQECKEIVTKIKFLVEEGSYKYILSGSLLGVELSGLKSAPVGYVKVIDMYPLDFEEFIIALGIKQEIILNLENCFKEFIKVDEFIHSKLIEAFKTYLLVGGMPEAVNSYINNRDFKDIIDIHNNIYKLYKLDFTKYEEQKSLKLVKTYDLISSELSSKNKRYNFSDLDKNIRFNRYENSFDWLINAGVALPTFNISEPRLPIEINKKSNIFKLFLSDVGLLTTKYGTSTQLAIINDDKSLNCGAIYENVVAQELKAHGFSLYYFNSHKQGEIDFVIEYNGKVVPIEVKSGKDYQRHSALNNVLNNKDYGIQKGIVFSNYNVSIINNVIYYPIYMIMFLNKDNETSIKLDRIDLSNL